jgi:replicative DNA helicase
MINKTKPHSPEAETAVIASCLLKEDGSVYDEVSQIVTPTDFYVQRNQILFATIASLVSRGVSLDEVALLEQLRKQGDEESVGGLTTIYSIQEAVDTPLQAKYYADVVREKAKLREIIRHSQLAAEQAYSQEEDADKISSSLESNLQSLQDVSQSDDGHIHTAAESLREDFKAMLNGTYEVKSVPTRIAQIDEKLTSGGIANGEVMVIAAPTSCGKTALALNIVLQNAVTHKIPGLYFSFEMQAKSLANRMIQTCAAVPLKQMRDGIMKPEHQKRVWEATDKMSEAPVYTNHYVRSVDELRAKARMYKRKYGIEWIVIDYLQLVPWNSKLKKHDGIAEVSHQIKLMAMELDLPVFLLAQVNREGAKRETGLTLYDLKDSGDIENDADIILLLWPDGADVDEAKRHDPEHGSYVSIKYNIAKQREGDRDQKGKFIFKNHVGRFY